jgi:anti-sigma regulatory factor (Ser/Thr protein kinase)
MNDGTQDEVSVSFPASPTFSRIGRVAIAGLALRLGVEIADVEKLRLAVDQAVSAFHGKGRIHLSARWEPDKLRVRIDNPDQILDEAQSREVAEALTPMVDLVKVEPTMIDLTLASRNGSGVDR